MYILLPIFRKARSSFFRVLHITRAEFEWRMLVFQVHTVVISLSSNSPRLGEFVKWSWKSLWHCISYQQHKHINKCIHKQKRRNVLKWGSSLRQAIFTVSSVSVTDLWQCISRQMSRQPSFIVLLRWFLSRLWAENVRFEVVDVTGIVRYIRTKMFFSFFAFFFHQNVSLGGKGVATFLRIKMPTTSFPLLTMNLQK